MNLLSLAGKTLDVRSRAIRTAAWGALLAVPCFLTFTPGAMAQSRAVPIILADASKSTPKNTVDAKDLTDELKALRKQVSELQSAMEPRQAPRKGMKSKKSGKGKTAAMPSASRTPHIDSAPAMGMEDDMDSMDSMPKSAPAGSMAAGAMARVAGEMDGMAGGKTSMQSGAAGAAMVQSGGMNAMGCCMGEMGSVAGGSVMQPATGLPGFPGRSHLYHIGAEAFFLSHPGHITLSLEQQTRLSQIREKAMLDDETAIRKIAEAEQQMFVLTGADQPDAWKIEDELRDIEDLRTQQRIVFIRAVGEAARVLTDHQRDVLLGKVAPPEPKKM